MSFSDMTGCVKNSYFPQGVAATRAHAVFERRYGSWSIVGANAGLSSYASENHCPRHP
jgi:hypothetical protein